MVGTRAAGLATSREDQRPVAGVDLDDRVGEERQHRRVAAEDADVTLRLHGVLSERLAPEAALCRVLAELELPLVAAVSRPGIDRFRGFESY